MRFKSVKNSFMCLVIWPRGQSAEPCACHAQDSRSVTGRGRHPLVMGSIIQNGVRNCKRFIRINTKRIVLWALGLHRVVICFAHRKSGGGGTRKVHHLTFLKFFDIIFIEKRQTPTAIIYGLIFCLFNKVEMVQFHQMCVQDLTFKKFFIIIFIKK